MADQTLTEAELDPRRLSRDRPGVLGVVVAVCRGEHPWSAAAVEPTLTIGRDASADFVVPDAGVSRVHVRLERRGPTVLVTDLDSRNGTSVNGTRVTSGGVPAPVGAVIRLAKTILVVTSDVTPYLQGRQASSAGLVGGAKLDPARELIETFASTATPVLILGETGTGKEIAAGALHAASGRTGKLVALNCAAVPPELIDAELFGHTRGAFSNAVGARPGLVRSADGGTLFLDEIGELPPEAQAKLLRTLESGEVRAVGGDAVTRVDVRVVAATHRDLDAMATAGSFRTDLLHRIAGLRIALPSLAERIEDIPSLVDHFTDMQLPVSAAALEQLMLQSWPGNVRQLRNVVLSAFEVAKKKGHTEVDLAEVSSVLALQGSGDTETDDAGLEARVRRALTDSAGNVPEAAEQLGMSRSALYECLRRLHIEARDFRRK